MSQEFSRKEEEEQKRYVDGWMPVPVNTKSGAFTSSDDAYRFLLVSCGLDVGYKRIREAEHRYECK